MMVDEFADVFCLAGDLSLLLFLSSVSSELLCSKDEVDQADHCGRRIQDFQPAA